MLFSDRIWSLGLSAVMLLAQSIPAGALHYCRAQKMTAVGECCCPGNPSCCGRSRPAGACHGTSPAGDNDPQAREALEGGDPALCCEPQGQDPTAPPARGPETESGRDHLAFPAAAVPAARALPPSERSRPAAARHPPAPSSRPLYILHAALLR